MSKFLREDNNTTNSCCSNAGAADGRVHKEITYYGEPRNLQFPPQFFEKQLCDLGVVECKDPECESLKGKLQCIAPQCKWEDFRSWALVVVSCSASKSHKTDDRLGGALQECGRLYDYFVQGGLNTLNEWQREYRDWFGIWQVAYWVSSHLTLRNSQQILMSRAEPHEPREYRDWFGIWQVAYWISSHLTLRNSQQTLMSRAELHEPQVHDGINKLPELKLKLCQRRIWNFILASERGILEVPEIVSFLEKTSFSLKSGRKHAECTPEQCYFDDDNTTKVDQAHKCQGNCPEDYFDPAKNIIGQENTQSTAWELSKMETQGEKKEGPRFQPCRGPYMAISHVWADGTGAGSKIPGNVNSCLVDFFHKFAQNKSKEPIGIWWDTISMPTDREKRARAIEQMHTNYENALFTLVHDEDLVNFDWKDDGSPCLALVLSTWFSRGWTALELQKSKSVRVLFRNPNPQDGENGIIMKDLDEDVLAQFDNNRTHLAYRAATWVVMQVRKANSEPHFLLNDVVATLRSRYTSWARDRLIIGGQLMNIKDLQADWPKIKITKQTLSDKLIWLQALLHGKATIQSSGPWSWCPVSFLDLYGSWVGSFGSVTDGKVTGHWNATIASNANIHELVYSHESIKWRLEFALQKREKCLLLTPIENTTTERRALLVLYLGHKENEMLCQYVGTVSAKFTGLGKRVTAQIGSQDEKANIKEALEAARDVCRLF